MTGKEILESKNAFKVELAFGYAAGGMKTIHFNNGKELFHAIFKDYGTLKHDGGNDYMIYTRESTMIPARITELI